MGWEAVSFFRFKFFFLRNLRTHTYLPYPPRIPTSNTHIYKTRGRRHHIAGIYHHPYQENAQLSRFSAQNYQPSPRYRIIWEALKELMMRGHGDFTIRELERALERLSLRQYEDQTPLSENDWAQVENTVLKAIQVHKEGL